MSQEIRDQVTAALESAGVKYSVAYRGEKRKALGGEATMDEWEAQFGTSDSNSEFFEYFTGLGLRTPAPKPYDGGPAPSRNTLMWERLEKERKPVAPHTADVLRCLIRDGDALDMGFDEWCGEYGYDTDSRKADQLFDACRENARKLRNIIPREVLAQIEELLQDY